MFYTSSASGFHSGGIKMSEKKYVITVSRQFGSLGRPIARKLAERLGIKYYDRDIVDMTAKK